MRLKSETFLFLIGACCVTWTVIILFHLKLYPWEGKRERTEWEVTLLDRVQKLENRFNCELKETQKLLKREEERIKEIQRRREFTKRPKLPRDPKVVVLPVLVIACDRVTVQRCLDQLVRYRPDADTFPIIVSQDCDHKQTREAINTYVKAHKNFFYVSHANKATTEVAASHKQMYKKFHGYYKIAMHYKMALGYVLDYLRYDNVIIVEDDLDVSPDFFEYFLGTFPLLAKDPTLWCISAWNDNGKVSLINTRVPELLHRTDFFPGLGWLLPAAHWRRLRDRWPPAFFDDWLREPEQRLNFSCIRPEISRTSTFGKEGVSKGMYFDKHLRYIHLNTEFVPFTKLNLTYLLKDEYDRLLSGWVSAAAPADTQRARAAGAADLVVRYDSARDFKLIAHGLGLMDDFRSGVARTAYAGVLTCFIQGHRVYIAPGQPFSGYHKEWS